MSRALWIGVLLIVVIIGYVIFRQSESTPETASSGPRDNSEVDSISQELAVGTPIQASERFATADDALKAVKEAAKNYDLEVIESFTLPHNCVWCPEFYEKIRQEILSGSLSTEEKSFFAEILAVSGRTDNLEFVIQAYTNAKSEAEKESFLNAIELTVANEEVVKWMFDNFTNFSNDPSLRDSLLAAMTNQDSPKAIEYLYTILTQQDDPEKDAQKGLGLSEAVPPDESLTFLLEKLKESDDKYRRFVAAAILNNGLEGLKRFIDVLNTDLGKTLEPHFTKLMDHVPFDEEIEAYLKDVRERGNDRQKVFASKILEAFESLRTELEGEEQEDLEEPADNR